MNDQQRESVVLSRLEKKMFKRAVRVVTDSAADNAELRPAMSTLLEEVAEAILAARGKHDDPLELEIEQIAGVCINILWQLYRGHKKHVCNIGSESRYWEMPDE